MARLCKGLQKDSGAWLAPDLQDTSELILLESLIIIVNCGFAIFEIVLPLFHLDNLSLIHVAEYMIFETLPCM